MQVNPRLNITIQCYQGLPFHHVISSYIKNNHWWSPQPKSSRFMITSLNLLPPKSPIHITNLPGTNHLKPLPLSPFNSYPSINI